MTYRTSDDMLKYNALDCAVTWQCADGFFSEVANGFQDTYDHTIALYDPCMYMSTKGVRVDREKLEKTKVEIEKKIGELTERITRKCGRWVNPNSPKQVQQYFYVEKGIPPYTKYNKSTKKSSVTTDDKALQRIATGTSSRSGLFEAKLMQDYRGLVKLKGTYLDINFDADGRLRCDYKPRGTKFGRLSSAMTVFGTGMNMQNLPEEFTGFLVSDPGQIFIALDKAKAEWVVVAYESGDLSMINAIESGVDVHAYTAEQMFKTPLDIILEEADKIGHSTDPNEIAAKRRAWKDFQPYLDQWLPRTTSLRQCGKKSNHGLNYGETPKMFALINEVTEKEAKVIVDLYHTIYPGIKQWYERVQNKLGNGRILENCFGRKCRFLDKWNDELFKSAYSFIPQSTVGDIVNKGMIQIYHSEHEALSDWQIMRQVHDEINFQAPDTNPRKLARGIIEAARLLNPELTAGGRTYHIDTDCKVGYALDNMVSIPLSDEETMAQNIKEAICGFKNTK